MTTGVAKNTSVTLNWSNSPDNYVCGRTNLVSGVFLANRDFVGCTGVGSKTATLSITGYQAGTAVISVYAVDGSGHTASGSFNITVTVTG